VVKAHRPHLVGIRRSLAHLSSTDYHPTPLGGGTVFDLMAPSSTSISTTKLRPPNHNGGQPQGQDRRPGLRTVWKEEHKDQAPEHVRTALRHKTSRCTEHGAFAARDTFVAQVWTCTTNSISKTLQKGDGAWRPNRNLNKQYYKIPPLFNYNLFEKLVKNSSDYSCFFLSSLLRSA
jgi:hypothetical protein